MGNHTGALAGVRVLDLGQLVQGPQAAQLMSDMGADVIKVELPGVGDLSRRLPVSLTDLRSPFFVGSNRGKRGVTIDLHGEEGRAVFLDLVEGSDVVITNFVHGAMESWGLGYDVMSARNPRIIWGSATAYGSLGADAEAKGADIGGQAAGGLLSMTGGGDRLPPGVTIADHIGSQNLCNAVLAALFARERTGLGQHVEVSLYGAVIFAQASELSQFLLSGDQPVERSGGHRLIPTIYGIFETADGHIAMVGVPEDVKPAFFEVLGQPELIDDPRHGPVAMLQGSKAEFFEVLAPLFRNHTSAHLLAEFDRIGVRCAPVRDYAAVAADEGAFINGYLQTVDDQVHGATTMLGTPVRMSGTPTSPGTTAPELGEHTDEVLREIGYTNDRIVQLRNAGAI